MAEMTTEVIVASCKANGGYAAPHLNDQLFLHCKGFVQAQNLEPYKTIKVLWLEQNGLSTLSGLSEQQELVSLFVQNNALCTLRTFDAPLRNLRVLNISHNFLTSLSGLGDACPMLETLQASHNRLASLHACEDLFKLRDTLTSVDLSFNVIEDYEPAANAAAADTEPVSAASASDDIHIVEVNASATGTAMAPFEVPRKKDPLLIVQFFQKLPKVSVVYLQGNEISHGLKQYRRNMVLHLPALTYLDDRPVFPEERRVVEAWGRGGEEAEAAERAAIRKEKQKHLNSCVQVLTEKMDQNREVRDRLTKRWEQQRAQELEALVERRRQHKIDRQTLTDNEDAARTVSEKAEQDARWDLEELFAIAHARVQSEEPAHQHAYAQALAVAHVTAEAQREVDAEAALESADPPLTMAEHGGATLGDLARTDDEVLEEMELEIQHVLHDLDTSILSAQRRRCSGSAGQLPLTEELATTGGAPRMENHSTATRETARAERAAHAAVEQTAERLRTDRARRQASRQAVWQQFDAWEKRAAKQS